LNKSYFTNRQDRYVSFQSKTLANYCAAFIDAASTFSYHLSADPQGIGHELIWSHDSHPHRFHANAAAKLRALHAIHMTEQRDTTNAEDILVYPILQMGQFGVRQEEAFLSSLFSTTARHADVKVNLTSGYFGLAPQYRQLVINSSTPIQLLCAAPSVRTFLPCPYVTH
jgi:CDP-diacylglycerol--glycerol-3-phosphate 3-phosphatidyltransferase